MKLIVQIPCYNEADNIAAVIQAIPRDIEGIDKVEILIIDDGSTDGTAELARTLGVEHILINCSNKGLAYSFRQGLEECVRQHADIIVNTDGDNQYKGEDIALLVKPILEQRAEIVVGDRGGYSNKHFSFFKRCLQVFGSFVIARATALPVSDAVSGFRAISRSAAQQINIVSDFSYTIEMLIQASAKRLNVLSVPIRTNEKTRESRLFRSIPQFLKMSVSTLARIYTMYRPLQVFLFIGLVAMACGVLPIVRFLYFFLHGAGDGHVQSLVLGSTLLILGFITILMGLVADLIGFNRKLTEKVLHRIEVLEEKLDQKEDLIAAHELEQRRKNARKSA
ncbi:glycosyltransferase family 2 protein [Shewanella sp. cp20]|uniref:glycosyltransferase family 2 protein n=1 Tax=Shewanella sp. cp20 TaxID=1521167 RepID=UPI0005A04BE7|nr:glycosyltransferase family 2 protein [Shewanella sp. cp20]KIO36733.1 glycosyl transferase [Shewanella sp. cp20]